MADDTAAAIPDLAAALTDGVPAGYLRLFLDEGPPLDELLREAARRSDPVAVGGYAALVLRAATTAAAATAAAAAPSSDEGLSDRELEVLRLLATELTGPEIARHLFVSVFALSGVGYLAGGVLFGLALFRARILARWASGLLVLGTLATLALHVLPHSFERPFAVPVGVALIGLGISLWRDRRKTAAITVGDLAPARAGHAAAR